MIDIKKLRENPEFFKKSSEKKQVNIDFDKILELDKKRRELLSLYETFRAEQNKANTEIVKLEGKDKENKIRELKEISNKIKDFGKELEEIEKKLQELILQIPNPPLSDVPEGKDETENVVVKKWSEPKKFLFKPKDHIQIGEDLDIIDIDRAGKVSGTRFYYLKNEAVLLEFALINFVYEILLKEKFIPILPPVLAKEEIFIGMGYLPAADSEMYKTTLDELRLAATSEQTIGPYYKDEILKEEELPKRFVGFSSCFRREAGSYGKDVKGILRVHQFDKVEMFIFCKEEESENEHQLILSLEEKIMQELKIPYQIVIMCTGDLGMPAAKKYDVEAWIPSQGKYRETHSCSNCTDFQARRLNIRYKTKEGKIKYLHTLNGTALAIGRALIAILENYQKEDGTIIIPEVLRKYYLGKNRIGKN